MSVESRPALYKAMSVVFVLSLGSSLFTGLVVPYLIAKPGEGTFNPDWLSGLSLVLGLIAAATVPFAWRWAYRRRR